MSTIYRVIEHKDDPKRERTLNHSLGGELADEKMYEHARAQGISEVYRGEINPISTTSDLCPFCGKDRKDWGSVVRISSPNQLDRFYVSCGNCKAGGPVTEDSTQAIPLWSQRNCVKSGGLI